MKKRIQATLLAVIIALTAAACGNAVTAPEAQGVWEVAEDNTVATGEEGVEDEAGAAGISDETASEPEVTPKPAPTDEPAPTVEPTPEPTEELMATATAESEDFDKNVTPAEAVTETPVPEEVDAKTAAARAKIAEAEANMDFFSCTPQDYIDAGYLSEETAYGFMQEEQPAQETPAVEQPAQEAEAPAPAVSSDIFGEVNNMTNDQYAAVLPVLQDMAAAALATGTTDLDHVRAASQMVYAYAANAVYTTEGNYAKPYGLIFEGVYTCAATCRTTAMVLMLMGYPDVTCHNLNQWTHQWVTLTIDGQAGWADGIAGIADYGAYPMFGEGAPGYYEDPVTGLTWYY